MAAERSPGLQSEWRVTEVKLEEHGMVNQGKEAWVNVSSLQDGGVVAGAESGRVVAWRRDGTAIRLSTPRHRAVVNCVRVLPDGDTIVAASSDKTVSVFSLTTGKRLRTLTDHTRKVHWLVLVPPPPTFALNSAVANGGWTLVTVGNDKVCRVWDVTSWACLRSFTAHSAGAYAGVLLDPAAGTVATGDTDGDIHVWNARTGDALVHMKDAHPTWITGLAYLPSNKALVSVAADATVRRWDVGTGRCTAAPAHPAGRCTCIVVLDVAKGLFATSSYNRNMSVWDGNTMEVIRVVRAAPFRLSAVALLPQHDWAQAVQPGAGGSVGVAAGLLPPTAQPSYPFKVTVALGSLNLQPVQQVSLTLTHMPNEDARQQWDAVPEHETPQEVDAASARGFVNPLWWAAAGLAAVVVVAGGVWWATRPSPKPQE